MGKGSSKTLSEEEQLASDYSIDHRLQEDSLTYLTHKHSHQQYLLRQLLTNDQSEYEELTRKLQQRTLIRSPHITQLETIEHRKEDSLCSNDFRVYSLWQYPRRTLKEELEQRALLRQPFSQAELRTLLLQAAQGLATYQEHKKSHECLTSSTILLSPSGSAKVVDILAVPMRPNLEVVFHKRTTRGVYLSPEQCRVIESQEFNHLTPDPFREDVFVLGMILLDCALLERQDQCYHNDYERVNWPRINEKLTLVQSKYGSDLRIILQEMLNPSLPQRMEWTGLIQRLSNAPGSEPLVRVGKVERSSGVRESVVQVAVRPAEQLTTFKPRNSYIFTYNSNADKEVRPVTYLPPKIEQVPIIRRVPLAQEQPVPILPCSALNISMSSKFTPIALTNVKPNAANNSTTGQTRPPTTVNNEFKSNSPIAVVQSEQLPPDIKHFSLHLNEPVFSIDQYSEGKRYEGYKVNGKKEGEGSFYLDNKLCFTGHWKQDLMEGEGKLYYQSGSIAYDGHFQKDRFHGFGKLYNEAPEKLLTAFDYSNFEDIEEYWTSYEGCFESDLKEGKGELFLTNGEHFAGNFHRDFVEGEGTYTTGEGKQVRGIWHENKLERVLE